MEDLTAALSLLAQVLPQLESLIAGNPASFNIPAVDVTIGGTKYSLAAAITVKKAV